MARERLIIEVTESGTRVVQRRLQDVGGAAAATTANVDILKRALTYLGGALVLRESLRTLASFSQAMSTVKAVSGATEAQFEALRARAKELGAETRFTATQAAEGMVLLSRAGFTAGESLTSVTDVLLLAQAGGLDLASAADIAASTLRGFRLEADQASRVADVLATGANRANTTVGELGDGMKYVAPIAAGLGISLEESTAAMLALSDAGLKGQMAGTGLRRILSELESPSAKSAKLLRGLGLTADDVRVSEVGLTAALTRLREAGIDTGLALEIFGDRGGPAFEVVSSSIPKVQALTAALEDSRGTAARVAAIMDDNLNGAFLRLRSALEAVLLSAADSDTTLGRVFVGAVNSLATAIRWLSSHTAILGGVLGTLALMTLPKVFAAVRSLFLLVAAHPFGALALGIGATVGYLIQYQDEIKTSATGTATLRDLIAAVGDEAGAVFEVVKETVAGLVAEVRGLVSGVSTDVDVTLRDVLDLGALVYDSFVGFFSGVASTVAALFQHLPDAIGDWFIQGTNLAIGAVESLLNAAVDGINEVIKLATDAINAARLALGKDAISIDAYTVDRADLGRVANSWEGAGKELGDAIAYGWNASFERATGGRDLVERLFAGAESKAAARELAADVAQGISDELQIAMGHLPGLPAAPAGAGGPAAILPDVEAGGGLSAASEFAAVMEAVNQALEDDARLAAASAVEREVLTGVLQAENQLRRAGVDLSSEEASRFLFGVEVKLRDIAATREKAALLEEIRGPEEDRARRLDLLNQLLADGSISQGQYTAELKKLGEALGADATQLEQFRAGMQRSFDASQQLGSEIANALTGAIDSASDALADFVMTGFRNVEDLQQAFSDLFASLAKDILKATIKMVLFQGIMAAIGGGAGAAGAGGGGLGGLAGFQAGGPVRGGEPIIVGEQGRELFVPPSQGSIVPAGPTEGALAPTVNVSVVNVTDPSEVAAAMSSAQGEEIILNVIQKNRTALQRTLA